MSNDKFDPHGFGMGASAALAVGVGSAIMQAGQNVAAVIAEQREQDEADRINAAFQGLLESNARMKTLIDEQHATFDSLMAQFLAVTELAHAQAEELDRLRRLSRGRYTYDGATILENGVALN